MKTLSHNKILSCCQLLIERCGLVIVCSYLTMNAQAVTTDIQINSLISQAIQTHPLVDSARAEQQATVEGVQAAKLNLLPVPSVSAGYDKDDELVSQISIRQPIWTGGKLTANVNQALFDDKAAVERIYEQQNQVAKNTIDAWQSYIVAVEKQRVYYKNIEQLNEFEAMMQRRVEQGVSAPIDLNVVTNRILQEQNAYQAAVEQQRIAAARLEQITGKSISQGSALTVPKLETLTTEAKRQSAAFEQMAFDNVSFYNPTVVKEYFQIESAKQEVKAKQANRYPTVYAQYEHAYYHKTHDDKGKLSLGLTYEPGAGFSNLALTRASQAHVVGLEKNQEASRRSVIENIQIQYQQFASAKSRELSLEASVAEAQIVVNSYRRQFIAGRKSWSEVLNAVRDHSDYQIQLVQTRADILGAFYKLQVDFGLMPWQQFAHNREPVTLFSPMNQIKAWLKGQGDPKTVQKLQPPENIEVSTTSYADAMLEKSMTPVVTPIVESKGVDKSATATTISIQQAQPTLDEIAVISPDGLTNALSKIPSTSNETLEKTSENPPQKMPEKIIVTQPEQILTIETVAPPILEPATFEQSNFDQPFIEPTTNTDTQNVAPIIIEQATATVNFEENNPLTLKPKDAPLAATQPSTGSKSDSKSSNVLISEMTINQSEGESDISDTDNNE